MSDQDVTEATTATVPEESGAAYEANPEAIDPPEVAASDSAEGAGNATKETLSVEMDASGIDPADSVPAIRIYKAVGGKFRSRALAQEKTGEFWVNHRMLGSMVRADFDHCEVAVFVGKNPWQSHSIPHARTTLRAIAKDPVRAMIVIDPRRTETAELADIHLQVRPGAASPVSCMSPPPFTAWFVAP